MATRSLNHHSSSRRASHSGRGAISLQVLVLMIPVFMGLIGFAIDLGRLYSVRSELKAAANSMAIAMATQLIGTDASTGNAPTVGNLTVDNSGGFGNKYDFNGNVIGQDNGLASTISDPQFYGALSDAIGSGEGTGSTASGSSAKYVRINISGETPIVFWNFLPLVQNRRTTVQATAVAGISAPLCTACGIEPIGVPAVDSTDATDFGYVPGTIYTFAYLCTGQGSPATLPDGGTVIQYVVLNRLSSTTQLFTGETSQLLRMGAAGLPPSTTQGDACFFVNTAEQIWATATPNACTGVNATVNTSTQAFLCGLGLRFDSALQGNCTGIPDSDSIASIYTQDSDLSELTDYTQYTGPGRRVITIPIVDSTADTNSMTVLGFRQFVVQPNQGAVTINAADTNGRFNVIYLGSVAPIRQGSFGGCSQAAGPGKVVLHR